MIPWKCRFGWHQWGRWVTDERMGKVYDSVHGITFGHREAVFNVSERKCEGCGLPQTRKRLL